MAYATRTYTPGSSTTTFALTTSGGSPIGYIQEADITVKVNGTTYTNAASGTNTYQISGTSTVEQPNGGNVVLNAGVTGTVILERNTAIQNATVVYTAGSTLTSTDLNNADNQIRFGLQEFSDEYASLVGSGGNLTDLSSFIGGSDTWVSNDAKAATTGAIDGRIDTKATAKVKDDIIATAPVSIADDNPSAGKINISVDAKLTELATMDQNTANALADLTQAEVQILDGATLTTTELNYVDGVTSAIQTQLNAKQASATDLTNLSSMQSGASAELATLTSTELDILDGATVTTNELNILDGVTATTAELNIMDGVTATTAEVNLLDGVTATTAELNYTDGVTSAIQTQLDGKQAADGDLTAIAGLSSADGNVIVGSASGWVVESGATARTSLGAQTQDAQLDTLSGMQAGTASVLAGGTALGATLSEINSVCENRAAETSVTNDNAKIPTSGAVVSYVTGAVTAVGGLIAIASDAAFPATASQPDNGVVVSISNAGGMVVQDGTGGTTAGRSTTGRTTDGTPATVTVNTFPTTLHGETLSDGVGLQVVSTGSNNTYTYQKLLVKEADVIQLSGDINEFNERYRTDNTGNNPTSNNHPGDLYFNQGTNTMLVRNSANSAWQEVQSIGDFFINTLSSLGASGDTVPGGSATPNGTAKKFTLSNAGSVTQQHIVSVNGVIQEPSASGSTSSAPSNGFVVDGSALVLSSAPASGSTIFVVTIGASVDIGAPSTDTVNTDHLMSGAVTNVKVNANAAIAVSKLADFTANDANNRVLTATGTKNSYNGEANLTFDGSTLDVTGLTDTDTLNVSSTATFIGDVNFDGSLMHNGDTNTLIKFPAADTISAETGGAERVRIDSIGRTLFKCDSTGGNSGLGGFGTHGWEPKVQVLHNQGAVSIRDGDSEWGGAIHIAKCRGTYASPTTSADDDRAGGVYYSAHDGTDFQNYVAGIEAFLDDTVASNDTPGRLVFSTAADGANTLTERLRITSGGHVLIGDEGNDDAFFKAHAADGEANNLYVGQFINAEATAGSNYGVNIQGGSDSTDHGLRVKNHAGTSQLIVRGDGEVLIGATDRGREKGLHLAGADQAPTGAWTQMGIYSTDAQAADKGGSIGFGGHDGSTAKQFFAAIKGAKENGTSGNYAGYLSFYTRPAGSTPAERLRIQSDGVADFKGDVKVLSGDIQMGNGRGISFAATSDAGGMASELLDDYEEGTFTPSIAAVSAGWNSRTGTYTKVGDLVTVFIHLSTASGGSTNGDQVAITGLPFTSENTNGQAGAVVGYHNGIINDDYNFPFLVTSANTTNINWHKGNGGAFTGNDMNTSHFGLHVSCTYKAA